MFEIVDLQHFFLNPSTTRKIRYDNISQKCYVKPLTWVKTKHHSQTTSTTARSKFNYIPNSPFIVLRNEIFSPRSDLSNRGLLSSYPSRRSVNVYRYPLVVPLIYSFSWHFCKNDASFSF